MKQLQNFLLQYEGVFALDSIELGARPFIDTGDQLPIHTPVLQTPCALRSNVDEVVMEMMNQAVVQTSDGPWASSTLLMKRYGATCFYVDLIA